MYSIGKSDRKIYQKTNVQFQMFSADAGDREFFKPAGAK